MRGFKAYQTTFLVSIFNPFSTFGSINKVPASANICIERNTIVLAQIELEAIQAANQLAY